MPRLAHLTVWAMAPALALLGCVPPQNEAVPKTMERPGDTPPVVCDAIPKEAVGLLQGTPCDGVVIAEGGEIRVLDLGPREGGKLVATGQTPEHCDSGAAKCELSGVMSSVGPLIVSARRGPESEIPVELMLGFAARGQLQFVPLWVDPPAEEHGTFIGPVFALEPRVCGEDLVLVAVPRLPGAQDESISEALDGLQGVYRVVGDAVRIEPWDDSAKCQNLGLALP